MSALLAFLLLACAGLILSLQKSTESIAGFAGPDFAMMITGLALVVFLGGPLLRRQKGVVVAFRNAIGWSAFIIVCVVIYSIRGELKPLSDRLLTQLKPPVSVSVTTEAAPVKRDVRIRRQIDGQFVATTKINAIPIAMIVDTGASTVVLRAADAKKAGIDIGKLSYSVPVQTANGRSFAAHIRLEKIIIGTVTMVNVEALIARPGALHQSLLGMSFLSRLRSYEFSGDFLTLRG